MSILDFLEFQDLLNLSGANFELLELINEVIMIPKYRIHDKIIEIQNVFVADSIGVNKIQLSKLQTQLAFLESCGHMIRKLEICFSRKTGLSTVNQYIDRFLSNDVEQISLIGNTEHMLKLTKRTFPNLKSLKFFYISQRFRPEIDRIYPNLEELTITRSEPDPYGFDPFDSFIRDILESYSNLRILRLPEVDTVKLLAFIPESNPNLEKLSLRYYLNGICGHINQAIHFENLKELSLDLVSVLPGRCHKFSFSFDKLEVLELRSKLWDEFLINQIIAENVGLRSLSFFNSQNISGVVDKLEEINDSHNIETLTLLGSERVFDHIDILLSRFSKLRQIIFRIHDEKDSSDRLNRFNRTIRGDWRVAHTIEDNEYKGSGVIRLLTIVRE